MYVTKIKGELIFDDKRDDGGVCFLKCGAAVHREIEAWSLAI